jgi:hypothetical protein
LVDLKKPKMLNLYLRKKPRPRRCETKISPSKREIGSYMRMRPPPMGSPLVLFYSAWPKEEINIPITWQTVCMFPRGTQASGPLSFLGGLGLRFPSFNSIRCHDETRPTIRCFPDRPKNITTGDASSPAGPPDRHAVPSDMAVSSPTCHRSADSDPWVHGDSRAGVCRKQTRGGVRGANLLPSPFALEKMSFRS